MFLHAWPVVRPVIVLQTQSKGTKRPDENCTTLVFRAEEKDVTDALPLRNCSSTRGADNNGKGKDMNVITPRQGQQNKSFVFATASVESVCSESTVKAVLVTEHVANKLDQSGVGLNANIPCSLRCDRATCLLVFINFAIGGIGVTN
jgi:hypothetical protein